ncbi:hypothetical protein [Deinococcus sp. RIT780]|uniref:hypothetical protein n=1 Tax=Deinococcus sp. RIT780 TaxID=2870472 RepID=UPI001C8A3B31|nr:hypothetical protein [Deinococcus sp. RIT780]MBX8464027.1 hypothetical protein [Deinococcus sp. RIT780]
MNDRHEAANLEQIRLLLEGLQPAPTTDSPTRPGPHAAATGGVAPVETAPTGPDTAVVEATGAATDRDEAAG